MAIFDEHDAELPMGEYGEVVLSGGFMKGYWNAPEQTAATLRGGWLQSGDLGRMDSDGFVYLMSRQGDQIEHQGRWAFLRELEETLYTCPGVEHAAAISVPSSGVIKAYVSLLLGVAVRPTTQDLLDFCRRNVPAHLSPSAIEILETMTRTGSGKLSKPALKARELALHP